MTDYDNDFASASLTAGEINALVKLFGGADAVRKALRERLLVITRFVKWREVTIGGFSGKVLMNWMKFGTSLWLSKAAEVMRQDAFATLDAEETIDTLLLTPRDCGYKRKTNLRDLFRPSEVAKLNDFLADRLPKGYALDLLPAEAGPHICHLNSGRFDDLDLGPDERLYVAMEGTPDANGMPHVFYIKAMPGRYSLEAVKVSANHTLLPDTKIVWRLRKTG